MSRIMLPDLYPNNTVCIRVFPHILIYIVSHTCCEIRDMTEKQEKTSKNFFLVSEKDDSGL